MAFSLIRALCGGNLSMKWVGWIGKSEEMTTNKNPMKKQCSI